MPASNPILDSLNQVFASLFGQRAHVEAGAPPHPAEELWMGLQQAAQHWVARWLPYVIAGLRCGVLVKSGRACGGGAIQQCAICNLPACLQHAMMHVNGDVVCVRCVNEYAVQRRGSGAPAAGVGAPPPRPQAPPAPVREDERRIEHLETLGLGQDTTWNDIHSTFRRLALKYHPDRHRQATAAKQSRMASKFKAINEAYQWLREREQQSAA